MAILSVASIPAAGLAVHTAVLVAADVAGDSFTNSGHVYLMAANSSAGPLGINVDSPAVDNFGFSGNALDVLKSVPASETRIFGPFPENRHNDANGRVQLTYPDGVTGLKVKVFAA